MTTENSWEERFEEEFGDWMRGLDYGSSQIEFDAGKLANELKDWFRKELKEAEQRGRDMAVDFLYKKLGKSVHVTEGMEIINYDKVIGALQAARSLPDQHE